MQLDPRTAVATISVLGLVYTGIATTVLWTGRTYPGFRQWLCAAPLTVLSLFLLGLRPKAPDWVSMVVANAVLVLAAILYFEGAREFRGLRPRRRLVYAGGIVTIGVLAFFLYVVPNLNARAAVMSAFLAVIFLRGSVTLLSAIPSMHRLGLGLTGALFGLCAATHMVRAVYCVFGPPLGDLFALSGINAAFFLVISVQMSLFPIGFILLADERVILEVRCAQNAAWNLQKSLLESEERLRLAIQSGHIGVFDYDAVADRVIWSPELCMLMGVPGGTTLTKDEVVSFIHPDDRARFIAEMAASFDPQGDGKSSGEFRIRSADTGEMRWVVNSRQTFFEGAGDSRRPVRATGVSIDITERKIREANDQFLNELSAVWMSEADVPTLVRTAAHGITRHLEANRVTIASLTRDASVVSLELSDTSAGPAAEGAYQLQSYLSDDARADLVSGRSVAVNDVTTDSRTVFARDRYFEDGVRAMVIVPLLSGTVLKAMLKVDSPRKRNWQPDEVLLLENVAARLWSAIERARTEDALRRSEERHEFLLGLSDALRPLTDAREMQEIASRFLGEYLHVNRVSCAEIEGDDFIIGVSYAKGVAPSAGRGSILALGGPLLEAYRRGVPIAVADIRSDPRFTEAERARLLGKDIAAFASVMLVKAGRWVSSFCVHNATPRVWTRAEVEIIRDVSERTWEAIQRANAEVALRERQERLRLALDASGGGSWTWDAHTNHVDWDDGFRALYGFTAGEPASFDAWSACVHAEDRQQVLGLLDEIRNKKTSDAWDSTFRIVRRDGKVMWIQSLGRANHDAEGQVTRLTGLELDVTGRKMAEEALRTADRRKNEFLATLAHELRNPLAALSMGLHLARRRLQVEPGLKRTLDMMDRQLTHFVRLIDDLLDIGRISAGKIELQLQPITLPEVLAHSMETVRATIESRRHEVALQIQPGRHWVHGDSARLTQVIANLIENAARYTEPGGRIRVTLSHEDGAEVVRVEDTGIGIPANELPHVFDLFSQVRVHQGKNPGGLGIGLALVRSLVELHGGTVDAASAGLGSGSAFTVRLPALEHATSAPAAEDRSQDSLKGNLSRRRVLIVDDNKDAAASLAEFLELEGHQTWVAHDGLKAIEIAKATELDVVLMDLGMPGLDGIETAKRMRAFPGCERLRMAALTGWGQESDRARTREAGFEWHLVKPINTGYLSDLVAKLEPIQVDSSAASPGS